MANPNRYTVKVSRPDQQTPFLTMDAYAVKLTADGALQIQGEKSDKSLSHGLWGSVEVRTIPVVKVIPDA